MTEDNAIRSMECPSCGAPIAFPEGQYRMRCPYCNVGIERQPPAESHDSTNAPNTSVVTITKPAIELPDAADVGRAGCLAGGISTGMGILFIVLMIVGLIIVVSFFNGDSPMDVVIKPLQVHSPTILIDNLDLPVDLLTLTYNYSAEDYALARLKTTNTKTLWRGPGQDSISYFGDMVRNDNYGFVIEQDDLLTAYNLVDGQVLWQSKLSDKVGYCKECLSARSDRVIVLTQDYVIQAFDVETGDEIWRRTLAEYVNEFHVFESTLAVIDEVEDVASLYLLNLSDGSPRQVINPYCASPDNPNWGNEISISSSVFFEPDSSGILDTGSAYILYGSFNLCVDRWNLGNGSLIWQTVDQENSSAWVEEESVGFTPSGFFFSDSDQMWRVDKDTGQKGKFFLSEDYELIPMVEVDGKLIVRAKRTRGSERFEIWGLGLENGEKLWAYNLDESQPFDMADNYVGSLSEGDSAWTWRFDGENIILITAEVNPHQLVTSVLDPSDGSTAYRNTASFKSWSDTSYYIQPIAWDGPDLWLTVSTEAFALNSDTGEIEYHYP